MDKEHLQALEFVRSSQLVLWDDVDLNIRHLICDLKLDNLVFLDYKNNKPYSFIINDNGRRILQAVEIGDV